MNNKTDYLRSTLAKIVSENLTVTEAKTLLSKIDTDKILYLNEGDNTTFRIEKEVHQLSIGRGMYYQIITGPGDIFGDQHTHDGISIEFGNTFLEKTFTLYERNGLVSGFDINMCLDELFIDNLNKEQLVDLLNKNLTTDKLYALNPDEIKPAIPYVFEVLWSKSKEEYEEHMEWDRIYGYDDRYSDDNVRSIFISRIKKFSSDELLNLSKDWLKQTNYDYITGNIFEADTQLLQYAKDYYEYRDKIIEAKECLHNYQKDFTKEYACLDKKYTTAANTLIKVEKDFESHYQSTIAKQSEVMKAKAAYSQIPRYKFFSRREQFKIMDNLVSELNNLKKISDSKLSAVKVAKDEYNFYLQGIDKIEKDLKHKHAIKENNIEFVLAKELKDYMIAKLDINKDRYTALLKNETTFDKLNSKQLLNEKCENEIDI